MLQWLCSKEVSQGDVFDHARSFYEASASVFSSVGPFCVIDLVSAKVLRGSLFHATFPSVNPFLLFGFVFQLIPLGLVLMWYGVSMSARPLHNKGTDQIAAIAHRAQMQLMLFCVAGAMLAVGALHWAGRV